jgi:hypothetical protein
MTIFNKESGVLLSGSVLVNTTSNRGFTAEEISLRASDKIISIGENAHPAIRDQAQAFKAHIQKIIEFYLKEAIKNDRATIANRLREAGHSELEIILKD